MSTEDPEATQLAQPEWAPEEPDATVLAQSEANDPEATVLAQSEANDPDAPVLAQPVPDDEATQLVAADGTQLLDGSNETQVMEADGTHVIPAEGTTVQPRGEKPAVVSFADLPTSTLMDDGIDALDDPYFSPAVPEDLTEAHAPLELESPVQSLPERRRHMPAWAIAVIVVALLVIAGSLGFYTYKQEIWGGKTVPLVEGLTETDAMNALSDSGFKNIKVSYQLADEKIGCVLSCSATAGTREDPSAEVTLTVASGRTIPAVVGTDKDAARKALEDLGATNIVISTVSSDEPDGTVISVDPAEGTAFAAADTVTLTVAEPYVVPTTVGLTLTKAQELVERAGLTVKVTYVESEEPHNQVVASSPEAGTQISEGGEVTLSVSTPYPSNAWQVMEYFDCTSPEAAKFLSDQGFTMTFGERLSNGDANAAYTSPQGDLLVFTDKPECPTSGVGTEDVLSQSATIGGVRLVLSDNIPQGGLEESETGLKAVMELCGLDGLLDSCTQADIVCPDTVSSDLHFICGYGEKDSYSWAVIIGGGSGYSQVTVIASPKNRFNGGVNLSSFGNAAADYIAYMSLIG